MYRPRWQDCYTQDDDRRNRYYYGLRLRRDPRWKNSAVWWIMVEDTVRLTGNNGTLPSPYSQLNSMLPDLNHLRILSSRAWGHAPKEKRIKVQDRSWQKSLIGYKGTTSFIGSTIQLPGLYTLHAPLPLTKRASHYWLFRLASGYGNQSNGCCYRLSL